MHTIRGILDFHSARLKPGEDLHVRLSRCTNDCVIKVHGITVAVGTSTFQIMVDHHALNAVKLARARRVGKIILHLALQYAEVPSRLTQSLGVEVEVLLQVRVIALLRSVELLIQP